jgi:hypothetical protein
MDWERSSSRSEVSHVLGGVLRLQGGKRNSFSDSEQQSFSVQPMLVIGLLPS